MKIKILSSFVLLFCLALLFPAKLIAQNSSQEPNAKINFSLQNLLKEAHSSQPAVGNNNSLATRHSSPVTINTEIAVFVKGNIEEIKKKTGEVGGVFKYSAG